MTQDDSGYQIAPMGPSRRARHRQIRFEVAGVLVLLLLALLTAWLALSLSEMVSGMELGSWSSVQHPEFPNVSPSAHYVWGRS